MCCSVVRVACLCAQSVAPDGQRPATHCLALQGVTLDENARAQLLCEAAAGGDAEGVLRLLLSGCEPSAVDYDRRSALHLACTEGHGAVVTILLQVRRSGRRWSEGVSGGAAGKKECA